ncbi:hypothetical protein Tco_0465617 [Tanacetum coccineum]
MGLWYPKDSGIELTAFLDTDHACCIDTRKSTSGGIQFLGEKLVSWMSKKQDCSAMSSTEAETEYQLADMFMKAFPQDRFEYLVRRIGMRCLTPAELEGLEVGFQWIGYDVLEFLGVGTTFNILQNIHILYLQYGVLTSSGYGILIFFPLWSLVSGGMDTPYLP